MVIHTDSDFIDGAFLLQVPVIIRIKILMWRLSHRGKGMGADQVTSRRIVLRGNYVHMSAMSSPQREEVWIVKNIRSVHSNIYKNITCVS